MATWWFSGFDWVRFHSLAPVLRRAASVQELRSSDDRQVSELAYSLDDGLLMTQACNRILGELCTRQPFVTCGVSLPELVRAVRKRSAGEEVADVLTDLALSGHNIEAWFKADEGLMGLLKPEEVEHLASHLAACMRESPSPEESRGVLGWARRLKPVTTQDDLLEELASVVSAAEADGQGLAAVLEE